MVLDKGKKTYQTEQKKQLLDFLREHKEEHYTIDQIILNLQGEHTPGKSTVYRLIKQLVEEGWNLIIEGPTGTLKTTTACIIGKEAINKNYSVINYYGVIFCKNIIFILSVILS